MQPEDQYSIDQDLAQWPVLNSQQVKGPNNLTVVDKPGNTLLLCMCVTTIKTINFRSKTTSRKPFFSCRNGPLTDRAVLGNTIRGSEVRGVVVQLDVWCCDSDVHTRKHEDLVF